MEKRSLKKFDSCKDCKHWIPGEDELTGKCYNVVEHAKHYIDYDKPYSSAPAYFKCLWHESK